jgi:hypothetical protein
MESEIKNVYFFSSLLYMAPVSGYVYNMHKVPTYAEIIEEAIIHPVDKIKLPDRQALFIRNLPQMTRFDEVDDPADIGKEQERMQQTKLQELTIKQLAPGATQSIERVRHAQSKPPDEYVPAGGGSLNGPPPPPAPGMIKPPGMVRRAGGGLLNIGSRVGSAIGNGIIGGMMSTVDYMLEPAAPPFEWRRTDYDAGLRAAREINAQQEQQEYERNRYALSWFNAADSQAKTAMKIPDSTAEFHIPDYDPPSPAGGASSSTWWGSTKSPEPEPAKPFKPKFASQGKESEDIEPTGKSDYRRPRDRAKKR